MATAPSADYATTIPHSVFMIYQCMFAVITPALIAGAFAERVRFAPFVVFSLLWAVLVYNPVCHWVWGSGGWLASLGVLDFAGGLVVHADLRRGGPGLGDGYRPAQGITARPVSCPTTCP